MRYLNSGKDDKQKIALEIAAADRVRESPIRARSKASAAQLRWQVIAACV